MLGFLLSNLGAAERKALLSIASQDKANGFYPRSLSVGSLPVEVEVPRTRSGDFRPASLPAPYQRGYSDESQALLASVLASSRSLNSAKEALHRMDCLFLIRVSIASLKPLLKNCSCAILALLIPISPSSI